MNKNSIFIVLFSLFLSAGTAFSTVTYLKEDKLIKPSLRIDLLKKESAQNGRMVKQLLLSVSELKESVYDLKTKPIVQMKELIDSQSLDAEQLKLVVNQLAAMQQQITDFKKSIVSLEKNSGMGAINDAGTTVSMSKDELLRSREESQKKYEVFQQQAIAVYENELGNRPRDIAWENNLEDSIKQVIGSDQSFKDAQLQEVNCQDKLCKVILSGSQPSIFMDDVIASLGEGVSAHVLKEEGSGDTIIYLSSKNENLPSIEGIN